MNRPILFVLMTLNTLFAAVLGAEWVTNIETPAVISQTKNKNSAPEEKTSPPLDLMATNEEDYNDLVERPMFIKGRKPVSEPVPESMPIAGRKKVELFVWELTGIFTTPKGMTAFLSRSSAKVAKDNYRKQKIGEELDGWKVTEIHTDNVVLTQANETKTLLLRKNKPKTPVPMNTKPRVPPPVRQEMQVQQGMQEQTLQTSDAIKNNDAPESETSEETVNPENP